MAKKPSGVSESGQYYFNVDEEIASLRGARNAERAKIANARRILEPLMGRDKTVDAALAALDGVVQ